MKSSVYFGYSISQTDIFLKVLQQGGTESPTKPKGRPRKHSIQDSHEYISTESVPDEDIIRRNRSEHTQSVDNDHDGLQYAGSIFNNSYNGQYMDKALNPLECDTDEDIDIEQVIVQDISS